MSWIDCLRSQTRHHYAFLGHAIGDVDEAGARAPMRPGGPSIAWEVGHCALVADSVAEAVGGRERALAPAFEERGALPHWGVRDAPGWAALRADWVRVAEQTLASLDTLAEHDLERAPAVAMHAEFAGRLRTRADFLRGHVFHVAYHLGQIGALRAALGLGWEADGGHQE